MLEHGRHRETVLQLEDLPAVEHAHAAIAGEGESRGRQRADVIVDREANRAVRAHRDAGHALIGDFAHRTQSAQLQAAAKPIAGPARVGGAAAGEPRDLAEFDRRASLAQQARIAKLALEKDLVALAVASDAVLRAAVRALLAEDVIALVVEVDARGQVLVAPRAGGVGIRTEMRAGPFTDAAGRGGVDQELDFLGKGAGFSGVDAR